MAFKARSLTIILAQARAFHASAVKPQQILVRRERRFLSKRSIPFHIAFVAAIGYEYWKTSNDSPKVERVTVDEVANDTKQGDDKPAWRHFFRFTSPQKIILNDEKDLTDTEKEKLAIVKRTFSDKEQRDKVYSDLLNRVNTRLKQQQFLGAGLPNTVGILVTEPPKAVKFYHYAANGILLEPTSLQWTSHAVAPRVATKMDNILAVPGMACSAFIQAIRFQLRSASSKPQVITRSGPNSTASKGDTDASQQSTGPNASTTTAQSNLNNDNTHNDVSPASPAPTTTPIPPDSQSKARPFYTHDNHVDIITSFLKHQKDVVRSTSSISTSSARTFMNSFWREFQHARALRLFETHDPPGGNVIFEITVVIQGPRRRIVLFVEGDYDVTTETWGPIFIEPMESIRSKARRK